MATAIPKRAISVFLVAAAAACHDVAAHTKELVAAPELNRAAAARLVEQPVAVIDPRTVLRVEDGVGALERPLALRRFFESLAALEEGSLKEDVVVLQFGDSHTAADFGTAAARRALVARFGDGGRGYAPIGLPWSSFRQEGLRGGMTKEWVAERPKFVTRRDRPPPDARHGILGFSIVTHRPGASAWTEVATPFDRIELQFLEQPGGGSVDLYVDDARVTTLHTRAARPTSAFQSFNVAEGPHRVELRARGDGEVRVFGATLDRKAAGVTYDALGINGARASELLRSDESHFAEQMRRRNPSLVVLAYGTNESGDDTPAEVYERQIVDALGRIARAVPTASCLLLGPPDRAIETRDGWVTSPKLLEVIVAQRRVAEAAGCAFYNQFEAMGGDGSVAAWALEASPRGAKDRVHLTRDGYAQLGASFSGDVLRAYEAYRSDRSMRARVKPMPLK